MKTILSVILLFALAQQLNADAAGLDLESGTLNGVPTQKILLIKDLGNDVSVSNFEKNGRATSTEIIEWVNGILSSDYGEGVVESDGPTGLIKGVIFPGTGVEARTTFMVRLVNPNKSAAGSCLRVYLRSPGARIGSFSSKVSWNLNSQTRYQKIIAHMGNPYNWGITSDGVSGIGLHLDDSGKAITSLDHAIKTCKGSRGPLCGGNPYLHYLRYVNWKGVMDVKFHFSRAGGLEIIEIEPPSSFASHHY